MDAQLVDKVYECCFVPETWPDVLAQLAEIAGARSGWMYVSRGEYRKAITSNEVARQRVAPLVASGLVERTEQFNRLVAACHPGFLREIDFFTNDELKADPFYRDVIYPTGTGWAAGITFVLPTEERILISLEREFARGPVEPGAIEHLDILRPHIARSALIAARLQLDRAQVASATLAALGLPALVLDHTGRVLAANELIEALTGMVLWLAHGRVALNDKAADRLLRDAIAVIDFAGRGGVRSFPVRDAGGGAATRVAHIIPVRLSARDVFARCVAAFVLTP